TWSGNIPNANATFPPNVFTPTPASSILVGVNQTQCTGPGLTPSSSHSGTMQILFGDGSVHGVSQSGMAATMTWPARSTTTMTVWYAYCTPTGGEVLPSSAF